MNIPTLATHSREIVRHDHRCLDQLPVPLQLLTNGRLVTMLTATGTGYTHLGSEAVTRWKSDISADSLGYFFYLRDLESAEFWSLSYQPTRQEPTQYEFSSTVGTASLQRREQDISARLDVCVHEEWDVELRRVTLTNHGNLTRSIELTSYAELVLLDPVADRAHPGFSKIFVETDRTDSGVLLAHRRPRRNGERTLSACHFLVHDGAGIGKCEFETDRNRFIGRGQGLCHPVALQSFQPLSGTLGSVLDPIFSLRTVLILPPLASAAVTFGLGAGDELAEVVRTAERLADLSACEKAFERADAAVSERLQQEGFSEAELPELLSAATRQLYGLAEDASQAETNGFHTNGAVAQQNGHSHAAAETTAQYLAHHHIKRSPTGIHGTTPLAVSRSALSKNAPIGNRVHQNTTTEKLEFANGFGGFADNGREYVIHLQPTSQGGLQLPPMPWNNVICNESIGFIASETGAGNTWASNSRLNRLTPWQNDSVLDPHSEAIYLRDQESGEFWSLAPGPVPSGASYEARASAEDVPYVYDPRGLMPGSNAMRLMFKIAGKDRQVDFVVQTPREEADLSPLTADRVAELKASLGFEWIEDGKVALAGALEGVRSVQEMWGTLLAAVSGWRWWK